MNLKTIMKYAKVMAHAVCVCLYAALTLGLDLNMVYGGIAAAYLILLACDVLD